MITKKFFRVNFTEVQNPKNEVDYFCRILWALRKHYPLEYMDCQPSVTCSMQGEVYFWQAQEDESENRRTHHHPLGERGGSHHLQQIDSAAFLHHSDIGV